MSFGGNFSAMSGLTGLVNAAVDLVGPLVESFTAELGAALPYGMRETTGELSFLPSAGLERVTQPQRLHSKLKLALDNPALPLGLTPLRRSAVCHYVITVEFDDGQRSTTTYTSRRDVRVRLAELVNDLTDDDGFEHFRTVTVTQAAA